MNSAKQKLRAQVAADREQRTHRGQGQSLSNRQIKAAIEGMDGLAIDQWCADQWQSNQALRDNFRSLEAFQAYCRHVHLITTAGHSA